MLPKTLQNVMVGMLFNCWAWRNKFLMNNDLKAKKDHQYAPNLVPSSDMDRTSFHQNDSCLVSVPYQLTQVSFPVTTPERKFCLFLTSANSSWYINTCYGFYLSISNQAQTLHTLCSGPPFEFGAMLNTKHLSSQQSPKW